MFLIALVIILLNMSVSVLTPYVGEIGVLQLKKDSMQDYEAEGNVEVSRRQVVKPEERQKQKVVFIWTTWRSGSTFLGELIKRASDKSFYR